MAQEQSIMFPQAEELQPKKKPLSPNSTLRAAILGYENYMEESGFSIHTIKAFRGDLRLLERYVGPNILIHQLGTPELNQFLYWLQYERGVPCSSKSYARRVTTLKSFFGWLTSIKITPFDPAAPIIHQRITTPLPVVLTDEEVDRLLETTEKMTTALKADVRPHLLVSLILQTGMKKAECMRLTPDDFEDSDPKQPTVLIRYDNPRLLHKERRLDVSPELMVTLDQYLDAYKPDVNIFECTPRNLEYVLSDAAEAGNVDSGAAFETLRWTCAFRDYRDGVPPDKIRDKLGLSKVTFRETLGKLEKLAGNDEEEEEEQ